MPRWRRPVPSNLPEDSSSTTVPGVAEPAPPTPVQAEPPKRRGRPPKAQALAVVEFSPETIAQMGKHLGVAFGVIFDRLFPENPLNEEERTACGESLDIYFRARWPWFAPYAPELMIAATVGGVVLIRMKDRVTVKRGGTPSYEMVKTPPAATNGTAVPEKTAATGG